MVDEIIGEGILSNPSETNIIYAEVHFKKSSCLILQFLEEKIGRS